MSAPKIYTPDTTIIDKRFIGGSILFGIGWGISGLCPGPALASLAYGDPLSFVFILAIIPGSYLSLRPFKSS
ncbi:MAG: YeeE/YedE family protein, partial [Alphaproteobacteria bacterium]|nr:YeeE/YedE family protein [Alphaproteobacteria bacterium]